MPHKVQVQAATVAGFGESREVEEVLFSEEQGTVYIRVEVQLRIRIINILKFITIYSYYLFPFCCAAPAVPVTDITVTRVNDTAVRVTWTALTLNNARGFPSYVVSVTSKEKEAANVTTPSTSVVVGGLMPHTEYNVTVQALTAGGTKEGPHSEPGKIRLML